MGVPRFRPGRFPVALLTLAALAAVAAPTVPVKGQGVPPATVSPSAPPVTSFQDSRLRPVFEDLRRGRADLAAKALKAIDPKTLDSAEQRRYQEYAVQAALRIGDRVWLEALNDDGAKASRAVDQLLLTARRFLQAAEFDAARAVLQQVPNPEGLSEIPRRRYLQLYARLEQLTGNHERERVYVAKLVDFAAEWGGAQCQACHADRKKFGDAVTTLDIAHWWAGERLTALLAHHGDADRVLAEARARLKANPADGAARFRAAFALRALGRAPEAEASLREVRWAEFPDRERRAPAMFAPFP